MIKKFAAFFTLFVILMMNAGKLQAQTTVTDYLHVPGPIMFDSTSFALVWSSRPVDNYYKHEYLPKGDSLERFNKLVLIDLLMEDSVKPGDLVYLKIKALKERKKVDAVVNYNLIQSPDSSQYILDFVESEGIPKLKFVEWNAYLYKLYKDEKGHKGVLLFGISTRSYGDDAAVFMGKLADTRQAVIQELIKYPVPAVNLD